MSTEWRARGNCGPESADWFFVSGHGQRGMSVENRAALELCSACPVVDECYDHAEAHPELDSSRIAGGRVWRGTARERRRGGRPVEAEASDRDHHAATRAATLATKGS